MVVNEDVLLLQQLGERLNQRVPDFFVEMVPRLSANDDWNRHWLIGNADSKEESAKREDRERIAPTLRDLLVARLLKIRSKEGGSRWFRPNPAQIAFAERATTRNIILKARQLGLTTYVAARFFVHTITHPGTLAIQVAHSQDAAEELFQIVHRFLENLPASMHRGALSTSRANVRQIVFPRLDSEYRVAAADENAGRGLTIHNLHCSEVARWARGAEEALASLRSALVPGGEIVLESTPNGASGIFYQEWQDAAESGYTRHFFPWWYDRSYVKQVNAPLRPFTPDEQELVMKFGLTDAQIAWRRNTRRLLRGLAAQEFAEDPVTCFQASSDCVFDQDAVDLMQKWMVDPIDTKDNQRLMVWMPPVRAKEYIIGVDPAGGGSDGDYACAEVIERREAIQCAELHGHFTPQELAQKLVELGHQYNDALIAVERNNHGHGVLAYLRSMAVSNLYRYESQDGWLTSASTRPAMLANLAAVLASNPKLFRSPRLLREFRTFVKLPDGSSGAASGTHDDCVMAMAIAMEVRQRIAGEAPRENVGFGSLAFGSE